jgi:hypothetical protein
MVTAIPSMTIKTNRKTIEPTYPFSSQKERERQFPKLGRDKLKNTIKFIDFPGGGSGPKHRNSFSVD